MCIVKIASKCPKIVTFVTRNLLISLSAATVTKLAQAYFYPRYAMLARVLAVMVCLSVCVIVCTRWYCIKTSAAFCDKVFLHSCYTVY